MHTVIQPPKRNFRSLTKGQLYTILNLYPRDVVNQSCQTCRRSRGSSNLDLNHPAIRTFFKGCAHPILLCTQEKSLFRLHGLRLVTTSLCYERMVKEVPRSPSQMFDDGDGMGASPHLVAGAYHDILKSAENAVPAMTVRHPHGLQTACLFSDGMDSQHTITQLRALHQQSRVQKMTRSLC